MKYPKEVHELRGELQTAVDRRLRNINAPAIIALIAELNGYSATPDQSTLGAIVILRELERDSETAPSSQSLMCDHCGHTSALPDSWPSGRQSVLCGRCNRLEAP